MEIAGEQRVPASPAVVWAALNDPESLRRSIPGCESLESTGAHEFTGVVRVKVGPVSATFKGKVELTDLVEMQGYTLTGRGQGGAAGFAKGSARVRLHPDGAGTRIDYVATTDVGGKLAGVGGRMLEGVARKMAADFFDRFGKVVTGEAREEKAVERERPEAVPGEVAGLAPARLPAIDRFAWFLVGLAVGVAATLYFVVSTGPSL